MIYYQSGTRILKKVVCHLRGWNMDSPIRVIMGTLLAVTCLLVFLPSGYVGAGGWVANPGFEDGEGDVPTAWNLTGNAMRTNTGPVYEGDWAARIAGNNDTLTQWLCVQNLTLPVTFQVWGWVYVSGEVTGVIAVDFCAGVNGNPLSATTILSTNDTKGDYVQVSGLVQSPVGTNSTRIRLLGTGWHDGAEVRFDEIGFYAPTGGFCFIATAAYGTETAAELDILRDFGGQVLLENALGSRFVDAYYKLSPPIADFIAEHDFLRAIVREMFVDPVVHLLQWSQGLWRT
jgi:hypothetical protein